MSAPESGLIRRADVIDLLDRLAAEHADMAREGDADQARLREAMEAAFTRAKYGVAFLKAVEFGITAHHPACQMSLSGLCTQPVHDVDGCNYCDLCGLWEGAR